jgi:flagellar basal body-associated protein FliL
MPQPNPNAEITNLMNHYKNNINQQETAEEMNRNTQHLYVYDYIYLICKVFLFIILGVVYYVWVGKKEVEGAYETTKAAVKETAMKASEKLKDIAPRSNATRT